MSSQSSLCGERCSQILTGDFLLAPNAADAKLKLDLELAKSFWLDASMFSFLAYFESLCGDTLYAILANTPPTSSPLPTGLSKCLHVDTVWDSNSLRSAISFVRVAIVFGVALLIPTDDSPKPAIWLGCLQPLNCNFLHCARWCISSPCHITNDWFSELCVLA